MSGLLDFQLTGWSLPYPELRLPTFASKNAGFCKIEYSFIFYLSLSESSSTKITALLERLQKSRVLIRSAKIEYREIWRLTPHASISSSHC